MQSFRADIQGLRALAVVPVLLFHFGISLLPGGFVGVDVFFVISGFVITTGLIEKIETDNFTFGEFYKRRAYRILPALMLICALTAAAAWWLLLPPDLLDFGRSLIAVLLSASNIWFWKTSGYFAPESRSAPLLHCWSLAVEEQFYLCMPLAMVLGARWLKGRWLWFIVPTMLISLAICIISVFLGPTGGFYLLPSRAWELMVGATVAAIAIQQDKVSATHCRRLLREAAALIGIGLIAWSMLTLHETDIFPGWNAIPPVIGAGLLIWAGIGQKPPQVNALLSLKPMVLIGTISYSLYLVHWPIAAFFYYRFMITPTLGQAMMMLALSVTIATASYLLIEKPPRKPVPRWRHTLPALASMIFCGLIGVSVMFVVEAGAPRRYPGFSMVNYSAQAEWGGPHCFNEILSKPIPWDAELCTRTHGRQHRILLWGDSFAAQYVPGLIRDAPARNADILQYTFAGCPPILAYNSLSRLGCSVSNARVPSIIEHEHIDTVVISARWSDVPLRTLRRLHETVATLRGLGIQVFVIGQSPEFLANTQRIDYLSGQSAAAQGRWQVSFNPALESTLAVEAEAATFIDPLAALCHSSICPYRKGKSWLFGDYGHFSAAGSLLAVRSYFPLAKQPKKDAN